MARRAIQSVVAAFVLGGCAAVLGIEGVPDDKPAPDEGGPTSSVPAGQSPDQAVDAAGAGLGCAYEAAGTYPVLGGVDGADGGRCPKESDCTTATGDCVECDMPSVWWECEDTTQCNSRPPFAGASVCCSPNLVIVDKESCPRRASTIAAGTFQEYPESTCAALDGGVPCDGNLALCRSDADCPRNGVCAQIRIVGVFIAGIIGACVER